MPPSNNHNSFLVTAQHTRTLLFCHQDMSTYSLVHIKCPASMPTHVKIQSPLVQKDVLKLVGGVLQQVRLAK